MKRLAGILSVLLLALLPASAACASFGLKEADIGFHTADGSLAMRAGSHPFALTAKVVVNTTDNGEGKQVPDGSLRDLVVQMPPGFVGVPSATPRCSSADFADVDLGSSLPNCADGTAVGYLEPGIAFNANEPAQGLVPVYNLQPPPGSAARLGFVVAHVPVLLDLGLSETAPYRVVTSLRRAPQPTLLYSSVLTVWGDPTAAVHDPYRGSCLQGGIEPDGTPVSKGLCPAGKEGTAFFTLPRSCTGPLETLFSVDPWEAPGSWVGTSSLTHDDGVPPSPLGLSECGALSFSPATAGKPTTRAASSPTGLDFSLDVNDPSVTNPREDAVGESDIKKAVVTLPEGMTINPSQAEGLEVCSEADIARETSQSGFGTGCPGASKIGTVEVETPLLPETLLKGSLFVAAPYDNPEHSFVALYVVIKDPELGIRIVQPLRVELDPRTGQIVTVAEDMPQVPFSHFRLHFREGARSPLASPAGCGSYDTDALLYPWAGGAPVESHSTFQIIVGSGEGPCPAAGLPPFRPGLVAGSVNNAAGRFSPFYVRLSRTDSEQEITHFSIKLPPGVTGKLAGIPFCSEGAIAAAKAREGQPHGGQEELDGPSCPAASEVGRTLVGSGVGSTLAYVPGKAYLAGPYHGSQLSIVAITAAKVGPFDLGTVVVREALRINPETAEVFVDATGSDPIPHIIDGIPVHLREIRVYVDRPEFALNPTSCARTSTASTALGSGLDFSSEADDVPVTVTTPYQAADCGSLAFKPRLSLRLRGGTKRGANPALQAVLRPRAGDANAKRISVALPHSEFLDQSHIGTVCTRVQFKAGSGNGAECPPASVYGRARAWTPLLSEPLEGLIFLRSSEHPLPDLVIALHGLVDVDAVGRIDSVNGGIRNTFDFVPDAPITKVVVNLYGGKKGLLENSTDVCRGKHRATVKMEGHNGKRHNIHAPLRATCHKNGKHRKNGRN